MESLYGFLESIIGPHLVARTFWFFATIFIFILAANWIGLIPGVGTIGWGRDTAHGFVIDQPLFRGANADLNMTLAMALIFFACWIVWALQEVGLGGIARGAVRAEGRDHRPDEGVARSSCSSPPACLEIVSILFRPISLSFRLYGNVFAGENMLETMARIVPRPRLAAADSVLLHGIARRSGAGAGVHAVDGGVHAADLSARGAAGSGGAALTGDSPHGPTT